MRMLTIAFVFASTLSGVGLADAPSYSKELPELIKALGDAEPQARAEAAEQLAHFGPESKLAVPALVKMLADEGTYKPKFGFQPVNLYDSAFTSLIAIGSDAIAGLMVALEDPDADVRSRAAEALGQIGIKARPALPKLLAATTDRSARVRSIAVRALSRVEPLGEHSVLVLLKCLQDDDPSVREHVVIELGSYPAHSAVTVPALLEVLKDKDPSVRGQVAESLGKIAKSHETVIPALLPLFEDRADYLDCVVCNGVGGVCDRRIVAADAIQAVGEFGVDAVAAGPDLFDLIASARNDDSVTIAAIQSISRLGPAAQPFVAKLVELLRDPSLNVDIRCSILRAFQQLGKSARSAVPAIRKLLGDESALNESQQRLSLAAACALLSIDPDSHLAASRRVLDELDTLVRLAEKAREPFSEHSFYLTPDLELILAALQDNVVAAEMAVSKLVRLLDIKPSIDTAVFATLERIGPAADVAIPFAVRHLSWPFDRDKTVSALLSFGLQSIPALISGLDESEEDDQHTVGILEALWRFGGKGASAVPAVLRLCDDERPRVRAAAAQTLAKIGASRPEIIPGLLQLVTDERSVVREKAALALGELHWSADLAVPALIVALTDEYIDVRAAAAEALSELGPAARRAMPALRQCLRDQSETVRTAAAAALEKLE